jgi:hypothetical protein
MRYFFSLEDGICSNDEEGEELADDAAAAVVAGKIAQDLSRNNPLAKEWIVVARDVSGKVVAKIHC